MRGSLRTLDLNWRAGGKRITWNSRDRVTRRRMGSLMGNWRPRGGILLAVPSSLTVHWSGV